MLKKFEYVLFILGFTFALASILIGVATKSSIGWIIASMMWIIVAFIKTRTIERMEKIIEKYDKLNK